MNNYTEFYATIFMIYSENYLLKYLSNFQYESHDKPKLRILLFAKALNCRRNRILSAPYLYTHVHFIVNFVWHEVAYLKCVSHLCDCWFQQICRLIGKILVITNLTLNLGNFIKGNSWVAVKRVHILERNSNIKQGFYVKEN